MEKDIRDEKLIRNFDGSPRRFVGSEELKEKNLCGKKKLYGRLKYG